LPAVLIPAVRAIETDGQLEKLQPYLPPEAYEALFLIACGYALDTAIRESTQAATAAAEVDPSDFVAALERPASRREFRLVGSEDELLEMLDASLDTWRVFLHPNQQAIVKTNFRGAARVLGGAGTGKTVVAMHRARRLATMFPDETILFATFNRNLATNIGGLLDKLCGPERARIEVTNIHRWVIAKHYRYWGERPNIVDARQADQC
jgi:superfamily I DNA and RNA helicase